jgi:hypothetical protein
MQRQNHRIKTNEKNTRDRIGRGGKTVLGKHAGHVPKPPKRIEPKKGK